MADTIERLYKLTVDGAQAARDLQAIAASADNLDKRMANAINGVVKFGKALAGAVTVHQIVDGFKRIIDSMDELSKEAQKVGVGAEDLQRLKYAADLSGVSAEKLEKGMISLAQAMGGLGDVGNKAAGVLRSIGVKEGDSAVEALGKLADAFASLPDGMEKTAMAADLFGKKVGADMIPLLNEGRDAFIELTKEADKFGGVISGSVLKSAEAFNDNLERLERTSKGAAAQLTSGMLPALQAISQNLVDSTTKGDGFVTTGEKMGRFLVELAVIGIKASATIEALGLIIGGLAAAIANPLSAKSIFKSMGEDIDALDREANEKIERLRANFEKYTAAVAAGKPVLDAQAEARRKYIDALKAQEEAEKAAAKAEADRRKAQAEAEKAARAKEQREKDAADALQRRIQFEEQWAAATAKSNAVQTEAERIDTLRTNAKKDASKAADAYADSLEAEEARVERLTQMLGDADEKRRQYAATELNAIATSKLAADQLKHQTDEWDLAGEAFSDFANQAAQSSEHLAQAFTQMIQTLIRQLLLFWAKKYIVDAILRLIPVSAGGNAFPENPIPTATGAAFNAGRVLPFARGGVISRALAFPMGLMGEAGPEAIMPLRRTADGNLGVQGAIAAMNVTINNNAPGVDVSARRTSPKDLEIIVEQTRAAIATDLRTGGNLIAKSLEQAYGIGRGAAAAF